VHEPADRPSEPAEGDGETVEETLQKAQHQQESAAAASPMQALLRAWLALGQQALATGSQLSTLLRLEFKLAIADGGRLLLVGIAVVLVIMLGWAGLSVLFAWLAFALSASIPLAIATFLLLQGLALLLLGLAARVLVRSLRLPASRHQLQMLLDIGDDHGTKTAGDGAEKR